jgi:hypothetical protein
MNDQVPDTPQELPSDTDEVIWNVSHIVPRSGPQFPMTPDGQLARILKGEWLINERERKIAELLDKHIARLDEFNEQAIEIAAKAAAAAARAAMETVSSLLPSRTDTTPEPAATDSWVPIRPIWRTYSGFRLNMQTEEQEARLDTDYVTKKVLAGRIGCDPVTITRAMKHYGLSPKHWPPSTWPEQEPPHQLPLGPHVAASLAASVTFAFGMLDALDGRIDGVLNIVTWLSCHLQPVMV